MDTEVATLIAASLAASAAIATLAVNVVSGSRRERREAQRNALAPDLPDLGEALHQVIATSKVQNHAHHEGKTITATNWRQRGDDAARELEQLRRRVRYPLAGLEDGFRTLTRLPGWVAHRQGSQDGLKLVERADELGVALHEAIESSWRDGQPPTEKQRARVKERVKALREVAPIGSTQIEEGQAPDDLKALTSDRDTPAA